MGSVLPFRAQKWGFSGVLVFAAGSSTREQDPPREKMILWLLVFLVPDITLSLVASPLQPFGTRYWQDLSFHFHFKLNLSAFLLIDPTNSSWDGEGTAREKQASSGDCRKGKRQPRCLNKNNKAKKKKIKANTKSC